MSYGKAPRVTPPRSSGPYQKQPKPSINPKDRAKYDLTPSGKPGYHYPCEDSFGELAYMLNTLSHTDNSIENIIHKLESCIKEREKYRIVRGLKEDSLHTGAITIVKNLLTLIKYGGKATLYSNNPNSPKIIQSGPLNSNIPIAFEYDERKTYNAHTRVFNLYIFDRDYNAWYKFDSKPIIVENYEEMRKLRQAQQNEKQRQKRNEDERLRFEKEELDKRTSTSYIAAEYEKQQEEKQRLIQQKMMEAMSKKGVQGQRNAAQPGGSRKNKTKRQFKDKSKCKSKRKTNRKTN